MSTYRERREARADRLDGWADKRQTRGEATLDRARTMADAIPFGQPMLVDHYSYRRDVNYRNRINSTFRRSFEDLNKATSMTSRAANIRAAADRAIYSDDDNAVEALTVRIEKLEAERARIKAYNASCRKGAPDLALLDEKQQAGLASALKYSAHACKGGTFPAYSLTNLSGNIAKQRKRLTQLTREALQ